MSDISRELRRFVKKRAAGCCEYCLLSSEFDSIPYHIDHITPRRHRGDTIESNLCLSCAICNVMKGSEIASFDSFDGAITRLFNPRTDFWDAHFEIDGSIIEPLTPLGELVNSSWNSTALNACKNAINCYDLATILVYHAEPIK